MAEIFLRDNISMARKPKSSPFGSYTFEIAAMLEHE